MMSIIGTDGMPPGKSGETLRSKALEIRTNGFRPKGRE